MLLEQDALLTEKETLLIKFSKTQEKLEKLKRAQKQSLRQSKAPPMAEVMPQKLNEPPAQVLVGKEIKSDEKTIETKASNDRFNPHKSSTPRDMSPVTGVIQNKVLSTSQKEEAPSSTIHDDDMKKIDLMKQRMELISEQQELRNLMEQQEEILREKQNQIVLQQKLHRERLEQLNRLRNEKMNDQREQGETSSAYFNQNNPINNKPSPQTYFDQVSLQNLNGNASKSSNTFNPSQQSVYKVGPQTGPRFCNQPLGCGFISEHKCNEDNRINQTLYRDTKTYFHNGQLIEIPINQVGCLSYQNNSNNYQESSMVSSKPINQFVYNQDHLHLNGDYAMQPRYYEQECYQRENHLNYQNQQFQYSNAVSQNIPQQMASNQQQIENFPTPVKRSIPPNLLGNQLIHSKPRDQNVCRPKNNISARSQQVIDDKDLIDLINLNNCSNKESLVKSVDQIQSKQCSLASETNKKGYETGYETEDLEESRLIEDLFFIK